MNKGKKKKSIIKLIIITLIIIILLIFLSIFLFYATGHKLTPSNLLNNTVPLKEPQREDCTKIEKDIIEKELNLSESFKFNKCIIYTESKSCSGEIKIKNGLFSSEIKKFSCGRNLQGCEIK